MTVLEFVEEYKKAFDDTEREKLVESILKDERYVPISTKNAVAAQIIGTCYKDKSGNVMPNSVALYVSYVESVLQLYTTLSLDLKNPSKDYDTLQEYQIVDAIFSSIGQDLREFKVVFDMCRDDYEKMHYSLRGVAQWLIGLMIDGIEKVYKKAEEFLNETEE